MPPTPQPSTPTVAATATPGEPAGQSTGESRPVAARVNGQPIFLDAYRQRVRQLAPAETGQKAPESLRREALEGLIDQVIIEQQAQKLNITVSDAALQTKIQELAAGRSEAEFENWLAANNFTVQTFSQTLRAQLIAGRLFEQITNNVPASAEQILLGRIIVTNTVTAREIIEQLKSGVDFAGLARQHSSGQPAEALQWTPRQSGVLPPEVEEVAFTLQPGQISGPIPTTAGYYIIKLEDKAADRPLTIPMLQALKKRIFLNWLKEQRQSATIERYIDFSAE